MVEPGIQSQSVPLHTLQPFIVLLAIFALHFSHLLTGVCVLSSPTESLHFVMCYLVTTLGGAYLDEWSALQEDYSWELKDRCSSIAI